MINRVDNEVSTAGEQRYELSTTAGLSRLVSPVELYKIKIKDLSSAMVSHRALISTIMGKAKSLTSNANMHSLT